MSRHDAVLQSQRSTLFKSIELEKLSRLAGVTLSAAKGRARWRNPERTLRGICK